MNTIHLPVDPFPQDVSMPYEAIIGLEVHAQLSTASKVFCNCSTAFGATPNTNVCPVCLGLPGALPVLNREAVRYALMAGLALNCRINPINIFARKNYFYPDLPKGYQISQFDKPLAEHGILEFETEGVTKRCGITRIHMEEDAGKLLHEEGGQSSRVDYNRSGVPLIEIVSEPDLRSAEEARAYMQALRDIVVYLGICDGNMEEGNLRCDANVSVRPVGQEKFNTKVEVKNINSFRFVKLALEYEIERQMEVYGEGGTIAQETRTFDTAAGVTRSMRSKEEAHDYRYFPEPDLVPLEISEAWKEEVRRTLPELPRAKAQRFVKEYEIPEYDAGILVGTKELALYFEGCVAAGAQPKAASNWIMSELLRELKEDRREITDCLVTPDHLASLLGLIDDGTISGKIAKDVFLEMYKTGKAPKAIIEAKGLVQISDSGTLAAIVDEVLDGSREEVRRFLEGRTNLLGFFVGQVMKKTRGQANPKTTNALVLERLEKRR